MSRIGAPKGREHALALVVDEDRQVVARVGHAQAPELLPELGVVVPGPQERDLDALTAGEHPGHVLDHGGVAAAEAASAAGRAAAGVAAVLGAEGVHGQPRKDRLELGQVLEVLPSRG
eukprot:CAMPEP_0168395738 /NCGR_PEP_ID=MMETSP0228-20121227/20198_1 /TAXON_ID=133427 /ORGANISM="Protoceratium reticulatum, Strain CCCM 535 (=CCMP 1889)" /LENGTH=117 /DNA_ID=CAMNT_0008409179 /DNA_START=949 /DNA_END=1300 /DNA_ORIENTATION=-